MAGEISFWKKYEFLIVAAIVLVLIYSFVFFNQQINFFLGNEPIIYLNPLQKSIDMNYGNVSNIDFDVYLENSPSCKASCSYSFYDRSRNIVVDNGSFLLSNKEHFSKSYEIKANRMGSGQDIYNFEARCRSQKSFICFTDSSEKMRSSFITVNYYLTQTETELKQKLKQNITQMLQTLAEVDVMRQQADRKYYEIGIKANFLNLSGQKNSIDQEFDILGLDVENLRALWFKESYVKLNGIYNESYLITLGLIRNSINNLEDSMQNTIGIHNSIFSALAELNKKIDRLNSIAAAVNNAGIANSLNENIMAFNKFAASFSNNTFSDYPSAMEKTAELAAGENSIENELRTPALELFFGIAYQADFEKNVMCVLQGNCNEIASLKNTIGNTTEFAGNYPDTSILNENCIKLMEINSSYSQIAEDSLKKIDDGKIKFPATKSFEALVINYTNTLLQNINNSYYTSFEEAKKEALNDVIEAASQRIPSNITETTAFIANENLSLHLLSKIKASDETLEMLEKCSAVESAKKRTQEFNFEAIAPVQYNITSSIETQLSDNLPLCCIFNECKPCCNDDSCMNDPKSFPIILLHGHSFAKDNSPEYSLDAFNKLQYKLQEDGYINAGIVSLYSKNEQVAKGTWGLSGKPVTVKASYYYDAFRQDDQYIVIPTKSENIDAYALRLKDIIQIVKERTGKPKVEIIAHSMGGLVARRYMQIFGDDDVEKLIMVGTPNKGISGKTGDYCGLIGENRECQDMQSNSIFINKLNDPSGQPQKAKMYSVIGVGCSMDTEDGDGIVLAKNAAAENSKQYFVNGTCGQFSTLHVDLLDIDKYEQAYKVIKEILKE
ncbi:MAG: alpha/beta fold hydrolase [Nanoarchaeota archaeon]